MNCLILAAGYATRLYPLTENFPKPLLKVGGRTILDWLLDDCTSASQPHNVQKYAVVTNHRFAGHFREWAASREEDIVVVDDGTSTNETRLGAVRDIQCALDELGWEDDLLVIAGDNLLDFSLKEFIAYAARKNTSCVMRYFEPSEERLHKTGVAEVDVDDRIISMEEKPAQPKSNWVCPPFYYYTSADARRVAEAISDGCNADAPGSFLAWLASKTAVHAMEMPGRRYDIGNLASYEQVCASYRGI